MEPNFWDERFTGEEYIYGKAPNTFIKECIDRLLPGSILFPGEGEGRNAVYAAEKGFDVTACDQSVVGRKKAQELAALKQVRMTYDLCSVVEMPYAQSSFDAIALSYIHVLPDIRPRFHSMVQRILKPGGHLVFEFFHPEQLGNSSGGPKREDMLYTTEMMKEEFPKVVFSILKKETVILNEGTHHSGEAVVIRGFGVKK
jgi:SAM-dependent methyltransferase